MTAEPANFGTLRRPVDQYLRSSGKALRERKIERLRFHPLILRSPLDVLLGRRRRLFDFVQYDEKAYGFEVQFKRRLKRSASHPEGRECQGAFQLLGISDGLIVVASDLPSDDHLHGPAHFTRKAYPLARRPFLPSTVLIRLIERFAASHDWTPTALDTWGFHRQSRRSRRDLERQTPAAAAREMAEQGRFPHRMLVSFRDRRGEVARLTFTRNCRLTMLSGNPSTALSELVLAGVAESMAADNTYEVKRATEAVNQEVVELDFSDEPFDTYDAMRTLCDAVRQSDGLNVAIIHLNPYLQAQILDFFTGAAIEMLVTDSRSVSLVPRSADCGAAIQRVATTIFHHFGEGKPKRSRLVQGQ